MSMSKAVHSKVNILDTYCREQDAVSVGDRLCSESSSWWFVVLVSPFCFFSVHKVTNAWLLIIEIQSDYVMQCY